MSFIKLTDLDLAGKRVLIRSDLNVPVKGGKVTSDARITASMPTFEHCMKAGAKVMVMSHLGRPEEGVFSEADSLAPVAEAILWRYSIANLRIVGEVDLAAIAQGAETNFSRGEGLAQAFDFDV